MSHSSRITALAEREATEFRALRSLITGTPTGNGSGLTTGATNIIGAIEEVKTTAQSALASASSAATIDDLTPSTTTVYSSSQTDARISTEINAIVNGAPGILDTLGEIAVEVQNNGSTAAALNAAITTKADAANVYTKTEIGDPKTDYVAIFEAALAA